jgi:hypothetical protein
MNKTNVTVASTKGTSKLVRPKFGPGMLLQHEDLEQLNVYTRELSGLLFRSLFGCGVVCGLVVKTEVDNCNKIIVNVGAGLALDCSGDPVYVPKDQHFALDENCDQELKDPLWVVLCGTTKSCASRASMCTDDDDPATSICTRQRDMFEIRVVRARPQCACGCPEPNENYRDEVPVVETDCKCVKPYVPDQPGKNCYDKHYDGMCGCDCGDGSNCDCDCILLAQLVKNNDDKEHPWRADHRVRRFIRPVLMRDPQLPKDEEIRRGATQGSSQAEQRLLSAAEEKNQMEQQLQRMVDENRQLEQRLQKAAEENRSMELQKTPEVQRQKPVQRKVPKNVEEKA